MALGWGLKACRGWSEARGGGPRGPAPRTASLCEAASSFRFEKLCFMWLFRMKKLLNIHDIILHFFWSFQVTKLNIFFFIYIFHCQIKQLVIYSLKLQDIIMFFKTWKGDIFLPFMCVLGSIHHLLPVLLLLLLSCFSRVWLCDPMDSSLLGSPIPGITCSCTPR